MFPDGPTVTNVLPPYVTPLNVLEILLPLLVVLTLVYVVPSVDLRKVPDVPTATNNPLETVVVSSVVVVCSSFSLQEIIVKIKRYMERIMSICFIKFPKSGLGEPNI